MDLAKLAGTCISVANCDKWYYKWEFRKCSTAGSMRVEESLYMMHSTLM